MTTMSLYDSLLQLEQADPFFASASSSAYASPPLSPSAFYYFETPAPGSPSSSISGSSSAPSTSTLSSSSRRPSSSAYSLSAASLSSATSHALASAYYATQSLDDALDMAHCEYNMLLDWMADLVADYQESAESSSSSKSAPNSIPKYTLPDLDDSRVPFPERTYAYNSKEETIRLQEAEIRRVNQAMIEQAELVRRLTSELEDERERRRKSRRSSRSSSSTRSTRSGNTGAGRGIDGNESSRSGTGEKTHAKQRSMTGGMVVGWDGSCTALSNSEHAHVHAHAHNGDSGLLSSREHEHEMLFDSATFLASPVVGLGSGLGSSEGMQWV